MDEIVLKSMLKWPNVPDVFGWLGLDRRGNWRIKEQVIGNPQVIEFIGRNYHVDEQGRWYFQNGPQRVFVTLAYAPFVLRTCDDRHRRLLQTHTGAILDALTGAWIDEEGSLILNWSGNCVGSVSDRDLAEVMTWFADSAGQPASDDAVAKAIESQNSHDSTGLWLDYQSRRLAVGRIRAEQAPAKFGFERSPQPA
ncbi:MAG: DUF2946 family protein, partial [Burkholderiales bacterium]